MNNNDWPNFYNFANEEETLPRRNERERGGRKITTANATINLPPYNFISPRERTQRRHDNLNRFDEKTRWHFPENDEYPETGIAVIVKLRGKQALTAGYIQYGNWIILGMSGMPDVERWKHFPADDYHR